MRWIESHFATACSRIRIYKSKFSLSEPVLRPASERDIYQGTSELIWLTTSTVHSSWVILFTATNTRWRLARCLMSKYLALKVCSQPSTNERQGHTSVFQEMSVEWCSHSTPVWAIICRLSCLGEHITFERRKFVATTSCPSSSHPGITCAQRPDHYHLN